MKRVNQSPVDNIAELWETDYKPRVLACRSVPIELVAEILGCSVMTVYELITSGKYPFGVCRDGRYQKSYDVFPLRFVAWYEGKMN